MSAQLELVSRNSITEFGLSSSTEATDRLEEMLGRYLGAAILGAISDPDVTEVYVNPRDSAVRYDTRSHGKIDSDQVRKGEEQPCYHVSTKETDTNGRATDTN